MPYVESKSCLTWREKISLTIDQRISKAKDELNKEILKVLGDIEILRGDIKATNARFEAFAEMLLGLEARVAKLENGTPPPPNDDKDWKKHIEIQKDFGLEGMIEFWARGLSYMGNAKNPSQPGKDVLATLACLPIDYKYSNVYLELRKYAINKGEIKFADLSPDDDLWELIEKSKGEFIDRIKLKASCAGRASESYMPKIPEWDPNLVYQFYISWDKSSAGCDIIVDGVSYSLDISKPFSISPTILILGDTIKYTSPPNVEYKLIKY